MLEGVGESTKYPLIKLVKGWLFQILILSYCDKKINVLLLKTQLQVYKYGIFLVYNVDYCLWFI